MQSSSDRDINVFQWLLFYNNQMALIFLLGTSSTTNKPFKHSMHASISNFFFLSSIIFFLLKYSEINHILTSIVALLDYFLGWREFSDVFVYCLYSNCLLSPVIGDSTLGGRYPSPCIHGNGSLSSARFVGCWVRLLEEVGYFLAGLLSWGSINVIL